MIVELKEENDFRLTAEELEAVITPKTKILICDVIIAEFNVCTELSATAATAPHGLTTPRTYSRRHSILYTRARAPASRMRARASCVRVRCLPRRSIVHSILV